MPRSLTALWRTSAKLRVGVSILLFFFLVALVHPLIVEAIGRETNPLAIGAYEAWLVPGPKHLLGTER